LGWMVILDVRGGMMIAPTFHGDDREAAIAQAESWAASEGLEVLGVREVTRVASRGLDKRV